MRLDGAIFAIEPRSVGGCLDLAVVFLREHFARLTAYTLLWAVPFAALCWWLVDQCEWTTSGCWFLFFFLSPFFGATLAVSAGRRVFGDQFAPARTAVSMLRRVILLTTLLVLVRGITLIASIFFLLPGYVVATRYGFLAEVFYLEQCPARKYESRLSDLLSQHFGSLLGRLLFVSTFYSAVLLSLFVLVDIAAGTLFGFPILIGRFSSWEFFLDDVQTFLVYDPRVTAVQMFLVWPIYAVTRLAWLFCYLDTRIRKEGWDIEIDTRLEGRRLSEMLPHETPDTAEAAA